MKWCLKDLQRITSFDVFQEFGFFFDGCLLALFDGLGSWKATFDWLIEHMDEVNAGKYRTWGKDTSGSSFDTDDFFEAALRRAQEQINIANGGSNA